jgi:hypothetical protein
MSSGRQAGVEGGLWGEGWLAHSVREGEAIPVAVQSLWLLVPEGTIACWVARVRSLAIPGWFGGGRVGALGALGRAVMLPAVQSLRLACSEGTIACWVARVRSLAIPGWFGGVLAGALRAQREL